MHTASIRGSGDRGLGGRRTATPVPAEHSVVPVFPDDEGGTVERFYEGWRMLYQAHERGRREHSHPGFGPHAHSHIKLVRERASVRDESL